MKQNINSINKIFERAANNYKYRWGIQKIEKLLKKNINFISEDILCKLGFLYDHLALKQKKINLKKFYENKAIKLYQQALKINPKSHRATWGIGRVWWHRKNKRAISYATRAYRLKKINDGKIGLYAQNIGLIYEAIGNYKKAEYWLLRGMKENKKDFGSYINLEVFYRLIKNFNKAKKCAVKLKKLYDKESISFKKTLWGKKIQEIIQNADKSLKKKKSS